MKESITHDLLNIHSVVYRCKAYLYLVCNLKTSRSIISASRWGSHKQQASVFIIVREQREQLFFSEIPVWRSPFLVTLKESKAEWAMWLSSLTLCEECNWSASMRHFASWKCIAGLHPHKAPSWGETFCLLATLLWWKWQIHVCCSFYLSHKPAGIDVPPGEWQRAKV